jgi:EmrB/QacA subfamily drug resistance transporter
VTAAAPPAAHPEDEIQPGTIAALIAMGLGVIVIANDFTALNVALPSIEQDFNVDVGTAQWVINAYALTFGMAIVTAGRLADIFGRRRVFFIGTAVFAVFSLLGGLAQTAPELIAMRVVMGIGGAMMWPAILGMTYAALPEKRAALAGGLILGAAGLGNAIGPLLGGVLTDALTWRWIFFLNVPIAIFAITVTALKVHQPPVETEASRVDYPGIATLSTGLVLLLLAFDQAADWGFGDPRVIAMLVVSVGLIAAFAWIEPKMRENALIPSDVVANGEFRAACAVILLFSAGFFATVLYGPQFMEKILGYSALGAGVGMIPMLGTFALTSFVAGPIYERLGAKPTIMIGAACMTVGPLLLSVMVEDDSGYGALVPGLVVIGIGVGLYTPSVTTAAVTALGQARASLAGGIIYMFQIAGGAVGIAITTAIFTITSENELDSSAAAGGTQLSDHQVAVMHGVLAGTDAGEQALKELGSGAQSRVLEFVRDSFVTGIQAGFRYVAIAAAAGFLIALFFVGGRLRPGEARQRATETA